MPAISRAGEATFTFRLEYSVSRGAERCPGEDSLHQELSRRLGYDPFAPERGGVPAGSIRVVIAPLPPGLRATYEHVDAAGEHRWTRTYSVPGTSARACEGAVEGVAVDLAAELSSIARKPPPAPASPALRPPPPAPPSPAPEAVPHRESLPRPELEIGLAALVASGVAPAITVGGALHVGVAVFPFGRGRPWFSFAIEGRADKPAADGARGVRTQLLAASLVACGHKALSSGPTVTWSVLGCAIGTAGRVSATIDGEVVVSGTYVGLGPRFGVEAQLGGGVAFQAFGDVLPTLRPVRFTRDAREIWSTADVAGGGGLAVLFSF